MKSKRQQVLRTLSIAEDYKDTAKIGKVNVDENQSVARDYGIRSIPSLLFFKNGQVEKQIVGAIDKKDIASIIDNL